MPEPTDEQIAAALKYAINELNEAIREAAERGLRTELSVREYSRTGVPVAYPQLQGRISRDL